MTADEIYAGLRRIAPGVVFDAVRAEDRFEVWDGAPEDDPSDEMTPYVLEVRCRAVCRGAEYKGAATLSGCWMAPGEEIGDAHGYLPQLLLEAADGLRQALDTPGTAETLLRGQLLRAGDFLRRELADRYEAQRKGLRHG